MSSISTIQTGGDVAVGRNVSAGGDVDVQGNARVGHNLRVDGWLEAPNIKGPLKGLYASKASLESAYPEPRPGWWALVGNTLPADVYRSERGKWVATGEKGGEFVLYPDRLENEVAGLRGDVRAVEGRIVSDASFTASETFGTLNLIREDGTMTKVAIPGMDGDLAGLFTPTRLTSLRSEMAKVATDSMVGVSYEASEDYGTIWLTLPSGNRKGVGIPGMDGERAGLFTPTRLTSLRAEMAKVATDSMVGVSYEASEDYGTIWLTLPSGNRKGVGIPGMDGERAGLFTPARLTLLRAEMTKLATDSMVGVSYEASEDYGTIWLTLPSGNRKGVGIPGMDGERAGLFTPNRLRAIRSEIEAAVADGVTGLEVEHLDTYARIWTVTADGRRQNSAQIMAMQGETAGLYSPTRHRQLLGQIERAAADGLSREDDSLTFTGDETFGTLSIKRVDGTRTSVAIPGMDEGKAGLFTPTRLTSLRAEMAKVATDSMVGVSYEASEDHGTIWLTLPSGNRKGVGIPGMDGERAGLFTPARLRAIRSEIEAAVAAVRSRVVSLEGLVESDSDGAINKFNEIVAFLAGIEDEKTLGGILAGISAQIASKADASETARGLDNLKQLTSEVDARLTKILTGLGDDVGTLRESQAAIDRRCDTMETDLSGRIEANRTEIAKVAERASTDTSRLRRDVGIWPFDGIAVNEFDEAWESLADGAIVYLTESGHFRQKGLKLTSALEGYNEWSDDGALLARGDRLYRLGNRLYAFDGTSLHVESEPARISEEDIKRLLE